MTKGPTQRAGKQRAAMLIESTTDHAVERPIPTRVRSAGEPSTALLPGRRDAGGACIASAIEAKHLWDKEATARVTNVCEFY